MIGIAALILCTGFAAAFIICAVAFAWLIWKDDHDRR